MRELMGSAGMIVTGILLLAAPAGAERVWPYGPAGEEVKGSVGRILLVGCGGGQLARLAAGLARAGIYAEICAGPGVPFLPQTPSGYSRWECIVIGPIPGGAEAFTPRQRGAIAEYVRAGGGILFVGGMDSFTGANGRGGYASTALAEIMPVELREESDHAFLREVPQVCATHPVLEGLPETWPVLGERNKAVANASAEVVVRFRDDPLIVVQSVGQGRSAAFMSCWGWAAQHEFTLWRGCDRLWQNLVQWAGGMEEGEPRDLQLTTRDGEGFHFVRRNGRPLMAAPDGRGFYAYGSSIEGRTLDFIPRMSGWKFNFAHLWSNDIDVIERACVRCVKTDMRLAVFAPQVGPFARFHDGSLSGDNIVYPPPWHRVPDFYSAEWQRDFRARAGEFAAMISGYPDTLAVVWVTNEPEIYKSWGNWVGPDFALNTPETRKKMRQCAAHEFGAIENLNVAWSETGGYTYRFASWHDFERDVLARLFEDYEDGRLNRQAHRWLLDFVCNRWLVDWHETVVRILREQGVVGPLFGARHNYNSAPDLSLIPWQALDVCGKNLYTHEFSEAYVYETWDGFRASGRPVLMSEWGVQPHKPPLGYIHGDEVNRAEQAFLGRVLAARCPWVVGDIWSNVSDIDYPWGFLDGEGKAKPFVEALARATSVDIARFGDPLNPAEYELGPNRFETAGARVWQTEGEPGRQPGIKVIDGK